ncbi:MAG: hypothetical protein JWR00_1180 [Rubritepida sp.]|nr:hypothetical protein [Rubritepida sp.]
MLVLQRNSCPPEGSGANNWDEYALLEAPRSVQAVSTAVQIAAGARPGTPKHHSSC